MSNVRSLRVLGRRSLERQWLLNSLSVKMRHPCEVCSVVTLGRAYATSSKTETPAADRKTVLKAADIAKRLRSEKERRTDFENEVPVSPLQKRVTELKQLTQQLQTVHPSVLTKALYRSILYQDPNLIAINKPYGVPIHNVDGIRNSIAECLPLLAKIIDGMQTGSQLHLCHRLEKETTGVLILAKTEQAAEHVQTLIRSHQVESKYLAVTVGVPVPSEGVIDIPIIEREVMGPQPHFKMGLSPLFRVSEEGDGVTRVRSHRQAQSAVTQYRVLDSTGGCSLVELQPVTGVKNQLRVHMALALACPILGDHKYAHWNKLAPQVHSMQANSDQNFEAPKNIQSDSLSFCISPPTGQGGELHGFDHCSHMDYYAAFMSFLELYSSGHRSLALYGHTELRYSLKNLCVLQKKVIKFWDGMRKLPEGALRRLGLVQSKTRYLPLHLHSRKITLPGVKGHSNITVSCPLPKYFTIALKRLQIPLPEKE